MAVPSGSTSFAPAFSDLLLDSFARIQVRPSAITADHMLQARLSAQFLMSEWAVRNGPCLWKMEEFVVPLIQGVSTYTLPSSTVSILDLFVRQFQMNQAVSATPTIATTVNSTTATVTLDNHGLTPGAYCNFLVPVAVGGTIVYGTYPAVTVPTTNTFTISLANVALSNATLGQVPVFTSAVNATTISVNLPYHGLSIGEAFAVEVATTVGGVILSGAYTVASVTDLNTFVITAQSPAGLVQTVAENGGLASIETQSVQAYPTDRVATPISRTDYAAQPNKLQQSYPNTWWFNRQISPQLTLWPVPDGNGPYELHYWAMVQFDDVVTTGGIGLDIPWRFLEAFAAGLAAKLSIKYPLQNPQMIMMLEQLAEKSWGYAANQDVEIAPLSIAPSISGYYR